MMKHPPGLQRHRRVVARSPAMPRFPRHEDSGATVAGSMNSCVHQLRESLRIQSPCQMMIGGYNHLLNKVFRFHYHSQKVIGSLGNGSFYPIIYKVFFNTSQVVSVGVLNHQHVSVKVLNTLNIFYVLRTYHITVN